jgi:hypothetical protein
MITKNLRRESTALRASRPTSTRQAKPLYPATLSAAVFDEVIALAIRGNRLEFHRLGADHAGHERYERALVIIHSASNSLRNLSFLSSRSRCPRERNPACNTNGSPRRAAKAKEKPVGEPDRSGTPTDRSFLAGVNREAAGVLTFTYILITR